tara:strand:- start:837 stop:1232 length:396 start_codon:yes stop_codon:yes gene_type:complete
MVLLDVPDEPGASRAYLEASEVLPSLEIGLEDMMRACTEAAEGGVKVDPINFLATFLMRNNPRHSEAGAKRLAELKRTKAQAAAKAKAAEAAAQKKLDEAKAAEPPFLEIPIEGGGTLTIRLDMEAIQEKA